MGGGAPATGGYARGALTTPGPGANGDQERGRRARRLPAMSTLPYRRSLVGLTFAAVVLVAACGGGTTASGSDDAASPIASAPELPISGEPSAGGGDNLGGGVPVGGDGELTSPQPGQLDLHPVAAESLESAVDGRHVTIRITWTSGIEPCNVLDSIAVEPGEMAFSITLREGHAPGNNICIEIAKQKHALVNLGELDPGTYTISDAMGGATPIQVVVG